MINNLYSSSLLILVLLFGVGCDSKLNQKANFPFETLATIESKTNKHMAITIIKTGIQGGATVPFEYYFYFSRDENNLTYNKLFLKVRGLENYQIKWTSQTSIDIEVYASRIIMFRSEVVLKNDPISNLYRINNFKFYKQ